MKRIILTNLVILLTIIFLIESIFFLFNKVKGNIDVGFLITGRIFKAMDDHCQLMKTHPLLGHEHDHKNKCKILGGKVNGKFIEYNSSYEGENLILVLGGSTTDGFFRNFSDGYTYPYFLNKLCQKNQNCRVLNAGVGGYGSSKELLKLLTEVAHNKYKFKYIISLNGINDIQNYSISDFEYYLKNPYMDENQRFMFESQKWIIKNKKPLRIFPNIQNFFLNLSVNINNESSNKQREYKFVSKKNQTDVWFFNVKVMREISRIINSNYLVFIQPTMGLEGVQSVFPKENVNDHMLLKETLNNDNYISNLRSTYRGLKEKCKLISFCNDITHIAPPSSESNYSNNRHHNARGNRIIAEEIYKRLKF